MLHILFAILISIGSFSVAPNVKDVKKQAEGGENVEVYFDVVEDTTGW